MADSTHESDRIMASAKSSLTHQRAGGRRVGGKSIGKGSAKIKREHLTGKLLRLAMALAVIVIASMAFGAFVSALGFEGLFVTVLLMIVAAFVFLRFPRIKMPRREDLTKGDLKQTVNRTELWLEAQRPALPAPAVQLIDHIGSQLDGLGVQLTGLDENTPAAVEVRKLVGEHLPQMVASYTAIPSHLRREARAGGTPDVQLVDGLQRISAEIDTVTRQLAEGALDELAIRSRYLDYRYGAPDIPLGEVSAKDAALPPPGAADVALPRPDRDSADLDDLDRGVPLDFDNSPLPSRSKR
jgi:hypothetical protein